jgi:HAD superfamily hydrolase (TIGR01509 family)
MSNPIRAFIFDMDDLLIASAQIWRIAEEHLFAAIGHELTDDLAMRYKGMNALDVAATIHRILKPTIPLDQCQKLMRDKLIEGFSGQIKEMPGAVDLVRRLCGKLPMALASGSPLVAIEIALKQLGIYDCFDLILSSESVPRGKPHPDVFLAAAAALNVPPENCLVFEDSLIGVRAAQAAGMKCFSVPAAKHNEIKKIATCVFPSLSEITQEHIDSISHN